MFLQDAGGDVNILSDVVTSYITFCSDLHLERKEVNVFPNNKPWITSDLRKFIVNKHKSYGKEDYRTKQKLLNDKIKSAKDDYKEKVEKLFKQNNPKDAWKGLKVLTGVENKRKEPVFLSQPGSADRLNRFYARFDKKDFSSEQQNLRRSLQYSSVPGTHFSDKSLLLTFAVTNTCLISTLCHFCTSRISTPLFKRYKSQNYQHDHIYKLRLWFFK